MLLYYSWYYPTLVRSADSASKVADRMLERRRRRRRIRIHPCHPVGAAAAAVVVAVETFRNAHKSVHSGSCERWGVPRSSSPHVKPLTLATSVIES